MCIRDRANAALLGKSMFGRHDQAKKIRIQQHRGEGRIGDFPLDDSHIQLKDLQTIINIIYRVRNYIDVCVGVIIAVGCHDLRH